MRTLEKKSKRYPNKVDKFLSQTGLPAVLKKYGEVSVLGINKKNGNIDVQVICASCDDKKMQQIFSDISYSSKFDSFYSGVKDNEMLRKKFANIHHVGMDKSIKGINYGVDVWFVTPEEAKKHGGNINVSRSTFYKLSRLDTSKYSLSALRDSSASKMIAYLLIIAIVFTATVVGLNLLFNGVLGLGTFSRQSEILEQINIDEEFDEQAENEEQMEIVDQMDDEDQAETETEPIPPEIPEGAYEGAFEEQLDDFPDFPIEEEADTTSTPDFVQEFAELPENCNFVNYLRIGDISDDVTRLQMFLNFQGEEIYPEGIVSGWFGTLTRNAVIRFQEKYFEDVLVPWKIDKGTGFVGITTTAKINELCILEKAQLPISQ